MYYIYISLLSPDHTPLFTRRWALEKNSSCISLTSVQKIMKRHAVYHPQFKSETIQINISKEDLALRFLDPPSYSWAQIDKINYFVLIDDELVEKAIGTDSDETEDFKHKNISLVKTTDIHQPSTIQNLNKETISHFPDKINDLQPAVSNCHEINQTKLERDRDERWEEERGKEEKYEQKRNQKKEKNNKNGYPSHFWIKNTGISCKKGRKVKAWVYPGKAYWECRILKSIEEDSISQVSLNSSISKSFEKLEIESY